ncbi:MAG: CapA family protein [Microcoleus vaginatus WJT46-NPBG5]|jgi:poly-gamma-glutamate synthesis protein (capsule biosynthesis protein)|nr:CapA family protein [Microcoleus vaginatus WJT46-NPBG5]
MRQLCIATLSIALLCSGCKLTSTVSSQPKEVIKGRVVSLDGKPVIGALVTISSGQTKTDSNGWFQLAVAQADPQWVTVKHTSFISRTRAADPSATVLIRLTPNDGQTIALHFTGDVMLGRRFYDPNEDGNTRDGLLQPNSGIDEHKALFQYVQPLLENADLTISNLESPLTSQPYLNPKLRRPPQFHQTKEYAFASAPMAAQALRHVGIDVIGLANNHLYDVLEQGIQDTQEALNQAGFQSGVGYFGAGSTEQQAWTPAVVNIRGQAVAFLGCTTISGAEHPETYVVLDAQRKGGAASCDENQIRNSIRSAQARYKTVVFMIHGGNEYQHTPSENLRRLTIAAREAGATLVINHHPHVVGGFNWDGSSLVAWTLGNFLFDQTVWPTFESYLLAVHLRNGKVVQAYTEPLMIDGYLPKGVTGELADFVARGAAGRDRGPFLVEDGAMEIDVNDRRVHRDVTLPIKASKDSIFRMDQGWWVTNFSGTGSLRLGRDLLWVGGFEDEIADEQHQGKALWAFTGVDKLEGAKYAYEGKGGVRLQRKGFNESDVILSPIHRILVEPGSELSIVGMMRSRKDVQSSLQISWYSQTRGKSQAKQMKPLIVTQDNTWTPFRLNVTVPRNTVALGLYLRLQAPKQGEATADFDNIRIIRWQPLGTPFSPLYNYAKVTGTGELTLRKEFLPGSETLVNLDNPSPLDLLHQ